MNYLETKHYALCKREVERAQTVDTCVSAMNAVKQCLYTAYVLDNITVRQYCDEMEVIRMIGNDRIQDLISLMEEAEDDD